jgi:RimJ/RimL family protein N-acetyltransferase
MHPSLQALDVAADSDALVEFLTAHEFPFHLRTTWTREQALEAIASGRFGGEDASGFWIVEDDERVGVAVLSEITDPTPLIDVRLAEQARGRGLGTTAVAALTEVAFSRGFDRVEAQTRDDNLAMRRLLTRLGFTREARYRRGWDAEHDSLGYAVLRAEWPVPGADAVVEEAGPSPFVVADILDSLPTWFGRPEANAGYLDASLRLRNFVARIDGEPVGVALLDVHESPEIHLIAVHADVRRRGVGNALVRAIEAALTADDARVLTVKTIGASHPDAGYGETRAFYAAAGFVPVEEVRDDPETPLLTLVKPL